MKPSFADECSYKTGKHRWPFSKLDLWFFESDVENCGTSQHNLSCRLCATEGASTVFNEQLHDFMPKDYPEILHRNGPVVFA